MKARMTAQDELFVMCPHGGSPASCVDCLRAELVAIRVAEGSAPPAQLHSETSIAAAKEIHPLAYGLRRRVYEELDLRGENGATDHELQVALEMNPSTERPRRIELVRAGLVCDSGERRRTAGGRGAVVWITSRTRGEASRWENP